MTSIVDLTAIVPFTHLMGEGITRYDFMDWSFSFSELLFVNPVCGSPQRSRDLVRSN